MGARGTSPSHLILLPHPLNFLRLHGAVTNAPTAGPDFMMAGEPGEGGAFRAGDPDLRGACGEAFEEGVAAEGIEVGGDFVEEEEAGAFFRCGQIGMR